MQFGAFGGNHAPPKFKSCYLMPNETTQFKGLDKERDFQNQIELHHQKTWQCSQQLINL